MLSSAERADHRGDDDDEEAEEDRRDKTAAATALANTHETERGAAAVMGVQAPELKKCVARVAPAQDARPLARPPVFVSVPRKPYSARVTLADQPPDARLLPLARTGRRYMDKKMVGAYSPHDAQLRETQLHCTPCATCNKA